MIWILDHATEIGVLCYMAAASIFFVGIDGNLKDEPPTKEDQ